MLMKCTLTVGFFDLYTLLNSEVMVTINFADTRASHSAAAQRRHEIDNETKKRRRRELSLIDAIQSLKIGSLRVSIMKPQHTSQARTNTKRRGNKLTPYRISAPLSKSTRQTPECIHIVQYKISSCGERREHEKRQQK